jgi:DNA polymerase
MVQLDNRRRAYLDAMGIDVWVRPLAVKQQVEQPGGVTAEDPVPDIQQTEQPSPPVPEVVETKAEASVQVTTDISELDWVALQEAVAACSLCELSQTRSQTVFGVGNPQADVLVIGEAPGAEEDKQGEPFVGRAGQLLNAMLKAVGFERDDVYIANILKCRPPQNRDPSVEEAEQCWPYLKRQIELIQPKVILALGRIAAQRLLQTNTSLARLRGKQHYLEDITVPIIVTYHPAYLLRAPQEKRKAWEDLQFLMNKLAD